MKLLKNATLYSSATLLQRGIAFFLAPLYARYLTPADYGVTGVVGALVPILGVLFGLAMRSSVTRLYSKYKTADPLRLRRIWGACLTLNLVAVAVMGALLVATKGLWAERVLGAIPFYPFALLGLATGAGQSVFSLYQSSLQGRQEALRFTAQSLALFLSQAVLTIILIVGIPMGAVGVLLAGAVIQSLFAVYSVVQLLPDADINLDRKIVGEIVGFSFPYIPHLLMAAVTSSMGKLAVNVALGATQAGLYHLGLQFGNLVDLIGSGVNRAFMPWFYEQMDRRDDRRVSVARTGESIVYGGCALGVCITLVSPDAIRLLLPVAYHESYRSISWICLAYVFRNIYYIAVAPLFLERGLIIPFISGFNLAIYFPLVQYSIRWMGWPGAAAALAFSQGATAILTAWLGHRRKAIGYRFVRLFAICAGAGGLGIFAAPKGALLRWTLLALVLAASGYLVRRDLSRWRSLWERKAKSKKTG